MDVDGIKPVLDFVEVVRQAVSVCDGLVAVIGRELPMGAAGEGWETPKT